MFEIPWVKYSSTIDTCQHGKYLLKRKLLGSTYAYEIWKNGVLENNALSYPNFMKRASNIFNANVNYL